MDKLPSNKKEQTTDDTFNMSESQWKKHVQKAAYCMIPLIRHSGKSKTTGTGTQIYGCQGPRVGEGDWLHKDMTLLEVMKIFSILIFGDGYKTMHLSKFIKLYI